LAKLQARTWLSRALVRLANTLLKDRESARTRQIFTDFKFSFTHSVSNKPFLIWVLTTPPHLKICSYTTV